METESAQAKKDVRSGSAVLGSLEYYRRVLDAMPSPVMVVDEDVRVLEWNSAAAKLVGDEPTLVLRKRGGTVMSCVHAQGQPDGCGAGAGCRDCVIRSSVAEALDGRKLSRRRTRMEIASDKGVDVVHVLVSAAPIEIDGDRLALLILEDITELIQLRSLIPICASCKKIRDDQDYWHQVDDYLIRNMAMDFTHGLCPDCLKALLSADLSRPAGRPGTAPE